MDIRLCKVIAGMAAFYIFGPALRHPEMLQ
jgi:hypothetical protein